MSKIVHIGYNKTGTQTCIKALQILGFKVAPTYSVEFKKEWGDEDIQNNIRNFEFFYEHPYREFYKQFDKLGTKFIYTRRDDNAEAALSCFYHILERGGMRMWNPLESENLLFLSKEVINRNIWDRTIYNYFNNKDNILVINFKEDKWDKLCKFLNTSIPPEPFPHQDKGKYDRSVLTPIRNYFTFAGLSYKNIEWG